MYSRSILYEKRLYIEAHDTSSNHVFLYFFLGFRKRSPRSDDEDGSSYVPNVLGGRNANDLYAQLGSSQ